MGLLGSAVTVEGRTGRKTSNALTLTFRSGDGPPLAVASQRGGVGVLLGFKNGGKGRFTIASEHESLDVLCEDDKTTVTRLSDGDVGTIVEEGGGDATFRGADGTVLARWKGYPYEQRGEPTWPYPLLHPDGTPLGTLRLLRTSTTFDLLGEIIDTSIWWDRAGGPLKVPTLGARLDLDHPVAADLGDLLLAACIDASIGPHDHVTRSAS